MKKTIAVMLVLLLVVSLAGCMYGKKEKGGSEKTSDSGKEKATMTRHGTVTSISDDTITLSIGTSSEKSKQKNDKKDQNEEIPGQGEDGKIPSPPSGKPEGIPENPPGASDQESAPPVGQTEPPALPPSQESGQLAPPDAEQEEAPGADEKTQKEGPANSSTGTKKGKAGDNTSDNTNKDKKDKKSEHVNDKSKKSTVTVNISEVSVFDREGQKISPAELRPGDAVVIGYDDEGTIISISLTGASSSDKKEPKKQNDESSGSSKKVTKAPSLDDSDSIFSPEETEKSGG